MPEASYGRRPAARLPLVRRLFCSLPFAILLLACRLSAGGQTFKTPDPGPGTLPITGLWQFHPGDDMAWAQPGFDDHAWERIPADQPWGDAGHPRLWGYAWYRRTIALDPGTKQPLGILLPPLDSAAEVFWNGVKVGSEGAMPPHPSWFRIQQPVAVALPPAAGASSGLLALRIKSQLRDDYDPPVAGGLQAPILLGSQSLVQKMPESWAEHYLRKSTISTLCALLNLVTSIVALVLWLRSRSQWVLLAVALFFGGYVVNTFAGYLLLPLAWNVAGSISALATTVIRISGLGMILLVADLPRRAGIKGFRFWARFILCVACMDIVDYVLGGLSDHVVILGQFTPGQPMSKVTEVIYKAYNFVDDVNTHTSAFLTLILLAACLLLCRRTLPRVLFTAAAALDQTFQLLILISKDATSHLAWLKPILLSPVVRVYGSNLSKSTITRLMVLFAVTYAVWDQMSRQLARQRFVDAELKAAQEIQQVLVPAASEGEAPGFGVSSVYRPASELGGDFFQVIPPDETDPDAGTLVVVGDVSGKGLKAAMTVSLIVGTVRTLADASRHPAAILAGLNRRLLGRTQGGFATCVVLRMEPDGTATLANAGHLAPFRDGVEWNVPASLPLGLGPDVAYEEVRLRLDGGETLTLITDGVLEARNHYGELYGFDRLNLLMQQRPSAEHVADTAVAFGQDDDITVLTVTRLATA